MEKNDQRRKLWGDSPPPAAGAGDLGTRTSTIGEYVVWSGVRVFSSRGRDEANALGIRSVASS